MDWTINITETRGSKVRLEIIPDPRESDARRYVFDYEIIDMEVIPHISIVMLKIHEDSGYNNGGSITVDSRLESCGEACADTSLKRCWYRVHHGKELKEKKQSQHKVSDPVKINPDKK